MADSKLNILVEAKNNASGTLKTVQRDIRGLDVAAGSAARGLGGFTAALGVAGLATLAAQAAASGVELAGVATQLRRVNLAALEMAGSQEKLNELMDAYMRVTGGMATRGQALADLSRLQAVGFADTAEELERFLTAARGASIATGQNIDYIIGQLQLTIANMSTMRLDQLGLGVSEIKDRVDALRASNRGMTQEAAYQEAVLGALIDKYGGLVNASDSAATGVERLRRIFAQMREDAAGNVGPVVDSIAGTIADAIESENARLSANAAAFDERAADQRVAALRKQIAATQEAIRATDLEIESYSQLKDGVQGVDMALRQLTIEKAALTGQAEAAAAEIASLTSYMQYAATAMNEGELAAYAQTQALAVLGNQATNSADQVDFFNRVLRESFSASAALTRQATTGLQGIATGMVGDLGAEGTFRWIEQQNEAVQQQIQAWRDADYNVDQITNVLLPAYLSQLRDSNRELSRTVNTLPQISDEFRDIQSAVSSVLSGALDPGVGVDAAGILESLGLRPDAINEDARRLADIAVNGFESPWLAYFQSNFPALFDEAFAGADPKAAAAQLLLDFQDGLRPELIDRDRAKELVKRMLLGGANARAMADEIAAEVAAELGVSLYEAQQAAASALGVTRGAGDAMGDVVAVQPPDLTSQGETARETFGRAFDGAVVAGNFVLAFADKIAAEYPRFEGSGKAAGTRWGDGFLSVVGNSLPAALLDILTTRLGSMLYEQQAQEDSLTGATP
jgi:hypothetical protein